MNCFEGTLNPVDVLLPVRSLTGEPRPQPVYKLMKALWRFQGVLELAKEYFVLLTKVLLLKQGLRRKNPFLILGRR
jgi:hypothetical protein